MPKLYDAHLHLHFPELSPYLPEIVTALEALPIGGAVVNGTTEADWPAVQALATRFPWVIPAYGLHPWYLEKRTSGWAEKLAALLAADPRATLGEVGLDRWMRHPDPAAQREVLLRHLELAQTYQRPITIHCLRAWGTLHDLLREAAPLPCGFLLHAYGGPVEMVEEFVKLGAYFSFSGYFLTPGKESKLAPFLKIPRDRLLVETDAPSMPLPLEHVRYPLPGTINHPANLAATYAALAQLLELPPEQLIASVADNFRRFFSSFNPPRDRWKDT